MSHPMPEPKTSNQTYSIWLRTFSKLLWKNALCLSGVYFFGSQHAQVVQSQTVKALPTAHAHNDYQHARPLLDALDHGFCSVEADIFLVEDQLLVAHSLSEVSTDRTLKGLYLEPLVARIRAAGGSVHGDAKPFTLMIDIKKDGISVYRELDSMLAEYGDVFSSVRNGEFVPGAVNVIISGIRPFDEISADQNRYVGIDGRLSDLESDLPANLLPLISDNWRNHFQWRGEGQISADERAKLKRVVQQVHAKGRKIRFWGIPDNPALWAMMDKSGVDLINTDDLAGLQKYLTAED